MQNQATKMKKNQLALFSGGEAVEDRRLLQRQALLEPDKL